MRSRLDLTLACMLVTTISAGCSAGPALPPPAPTTAGAPTTPAAPVPGNSVVANPPLVAFRMVDEQNGWGVSETAVLRTSDGGLSWQDLGPSRVSTFGYSVTTEFLDDLRAWILVADPSDILRGNLYWTSDGGTSWNEAAVPFGGGALRFVDGRNGWMMASLGAGAGSMGIAVFQTQDSGATWTQTFTNDPTHQGSSDQLPLGGLKNGITAIDALSAWIGGVTYEPGRIYLYRTTDGGRAWSAVQVTPPPEYTEAEFQTPGPLFIDPEVAYLPVHISHQYGVMLALYASSDGGASWRLRPQYIPQGGSIDFVSREVGFAWNGHNFYLTQDGAQTWASITPDLDFTDSFAGMDFVSSEVGFVLSDQADRGRRLYTTRNAGATWELITP